jgi:hypothetical protein
MRKVLDIHRESAGHKWGFIAPGTRENSHQQGDAEYHTPLERRRLGRPQASLIAEELQFSRTVSGDELTKQHLKSTSIGVQLLVKCHCDRS